MKKKDSNNCYYKLLFGISVLIIVIVTFLIYLQITSFGWLVNLIFALIVFLPAVIVFMSIDKSGKDVYTYLTLLIFYSGCIIAIGYFKPIVHGLKIPKLKAGTVGFRSNNAEVEIQSIRIWYQEDTVGDWLEVPIESIRDSANWLMPVKPYCKDTILGSIKCIFQKTGTFIIKNCTVLFDPEKSINVKYSNVRIEAIIRFVDTEDDNPGFAFITNSSVSRKRYDNDTASHIKVVKAQNLKDTIGYRYDVENLCLEFAFPYKDYPHPWIPALEWMPGVIQTSSFLDVEKSDLEFEKYKQPGKYYKLSAFVFDNQVRFEELLDDYRGVRCLFEAEISK
jgi:hypothetical protein